MTTDLATRRPIRRIASADFALFPVWEWALGEEQSFGHDQSFVRPTSQAKVPLLDGGHFIVAGSATLNDGNDLPACIEVRVENGKVSFTPMFLLLPDRHLDFSGPQTTRVLSQYARRLNTYAVSWALAVPVGDSDKLPGARVRRSLLVRLGQWWMRLRVAASGSSVPAL